MSKDKHIRIIDETIREGMQYMGVMFSLEQRCRILDYQEKLGVDICQSGYPPAHGMEKDIVTALARYAQKNSYNTRIAAMGRLNRHDADLLTQTGITDFHFHIHLDPGLAKEVLDTQLHQIQSIAESIKKNRPESVVSVAMLDIGRTGTGFLREWSRCLDHETIDILSLPDTSGMMAPNQVFDKISVIAPHLAVSNLSVHCHNDMGMANANGVMGILAGATFLEATALGIGERNGLSDLFATALQLKKQGFRINLNTDDRDTFREYYEYIDRIVYEQTGIRLLTVNTPGFGDAVKTHVAGTHSSGRYGLQKEENIYLNGLCGKHLVKKYLELHEAACHDDLLGQLTSRIKDRSFRENRALSTDEVLGLVASL